MMKNLVYTITVALTCMAAVPVVIIGSPLSLKANATEQTCAATVTAETSGASIRERVDAIAHCNTSQPSSTQFSTGTAQSQRMSSDLKPSQTMSNSVKESSPPSSYCPPVPNVNASGLFYYFEAIHGCRYGS